MSIAVVNKFGNSFPDDDFKVVDELLSENYFMTNNYSRIINYLNTKENITENEIV